MQGKSNQLLMTSNSGIKLKEQRPGADILSVTSFSCEI